MTTTGVVGLLLPAVAVLWFSTDRLVVASTERASSVLKWEAFEPVRRNMVALRGFLCLRVKLGRGTLRRGFIGIGFESLRSAKSPAGPKLEADEAPEDSVLVAPRVGDRVGDLAGDLAGDRVGDLFPTLEVEPPPAPWLLFLLFP